MNILYISNLTGASWAGPSYSVPRQIAAQVQYDNVFWYNCTSADITEWRSLAPLHTFSEFPKRSIKYLPEPFNHPDLIVVEQFYNFAKNPIRKEIMKCGIPYIIIPRGEFTRQAQSRKKLKKGLANILYFNSFARNAAAIHYLTEQEKQDSGMHWNENSFVIPNGTILQQRHRNSFLDEGVKCISIGRIEPYQKGLDLLVEACVKLKVELKNHNCTIKIYGPDLEGKLNELKKTVSDAGLDKIISFYDGIFGKEKEDLLLCSDVYIMTSRFEGHPMALIEAMSFGLPCIVTSGSNMRSEVEQTNCGWTADCTVESITNAFKKMLSEKELFDEKSYAALELSKEYSWDTIASRSHEMYKQIFQKKIDLFETEETLCI